MNALLTIGIICVIGLAVNYLPHAVRFIDSMLNWHFNK